MQELNESLLEADADAKAPPRIRLGDIGYPGLKALQKQIKEESNSKLRMPSLIKEVDEMKKDSSVAAALQFYRMMLGRVDWSVKAPIGATDIQKERAKFIETCMHDMKESWFSFITSLLSCVDYGFSVHEKVYKRRTKLTSKYDDGLVGWKSFPARSQSTISGWVFSEDGRDLLGLEQSLDNMSQSGRYSQLLTNGSKLVIPKEKFMLFRTSPQNDNPEGTAALKSAWISWRYKKAIEEQEMIGISRDLGGLLNIGIPARYMSADASEAEKAVYANYQRVVRNVANGEQSGIITPSDHDPEAKQKMFTVELLTSQGGKSYNTDSIVQRYNSQMLISLFADLLQLGNNGQGSFALSGSKKELVEYAIEFRLREIQDVLNKDLIPQTFALNGWSDTELPKFVYGEVQQVDLESLSKFIQRVAAVGVLEADRQVLNIIRTAIGADALPDDQEPLEEYMNKSTSRAGDGMAKGSGNGTSDQVAGEDNSVSNSENAA